MTNIIPVSKDFQSQLTKFITALQPLVSPKQVSYQMGTKYVRIEIGQFGSQEVHCFIDFSGGIYKAITDKSASKLSFGSIYNENCGVGTTVDATGVIRHENK